MTDNRHAPNPTKIITMEINKEEAQRAEQKAYEHAVMETERINKFEHFSFDELFLLGRALSYYAIGVKQQGIELASFPVIVAFFDRCIEQSQELLREVNEAL